MRAEDLDEAIALANATPFGLTSGIQTLDDREIARWVDRIEAGNLYVNRPITGAIVGRQPFGGWKASSVGPGAKAGGPNYVLQLARWRQVTAARRRRRAAARSRWRRCSSAAWPSCPTPDGARARAGQRGELRARLAPALRPRARSERDPGRAQRVSLPALPARDRAGHRPTRRRAVPGRPGGLCGGRALTVSLSPDSRPAPWLADVRRGGRVVEAEAGFVERLAHPGNAERVRVWEPISTAARAAANGVGLDRHRRARPRQRPSGAPLVPARADGLPGAPPLRQRDGARGRHVTEHSANPAGREPVGIACLGKEPGRGSHRAPYRSSHAATSRPP